MHRKDEWMTATFTKLVLYGNEIR